MIYNKVLNFHDGILWDFFVSFFKKTNKLGFTPCKTEKPLQGMELEEKEAHKD